MNLKGSGVFILVSLAMGDLVGVRWTLGLGVSPSLLPGRLAEGTGRI
jgi:hypothetical protein